MATDVSRTPDQTQPLWRWMKRQGMGADEVLQYLDATRPPVDVKWVARSIGVLVFHDATSDATGMLVQTAEGAYIHVSPRDSLVRQRFTIAHELGHLLLHPESTHYRDATFAGTRLEIEANRFAADLLMPMWMIDAAVEAHGADVKRLARMFQVSEAAMDLRLDKWVGL